MHAFLKLDECSDADRGGRLLIWALRLIVTGRIQCPLLGRGLEDACGEHAREVCGALCSFLCELASARRRRFEVGHPGWPLLTCDERRMLAIVAAAQNDCPALLQTQLSWLTRRESRRAVERCARALACALAGARLELASPISLTTMPCSRRSTPAMSRLRLVR